MSGIIGGAGSKSGVIGETEIDYEEGTFTPTGTAQAQSTGRYIKVGSMVFVYGFHQSDTTTTARTSWGGLPFTVGSSFGTGEVAGGSVLYNTQQDGLTVRFAATAKSYTFATAGTSKSMTDPNSNIQWAGSYSTNF
jgi:hypothetical protein